MNSEGENQPVSVLITGATGMLGHQMFAEFQSQGFEVFGTARNTTLGGPGLLEFDALNSSLDRLLDSVPRVEAIVNNIGVIKTHISDFTTESVLNALRINAEFPHLLAKAASERGIQLLQIATDCVFSGQKSAYLETDPHDAWDVYGKTKSLGEVHRKNVMHLRCSIIGREKGRSTSLVEWVLSQPENSEINGYTNHHWNGLTTLAFSKICAGIIRDNLYEPGMHHVVPRDTVTKFQLVQMIAKTFGRHDLRICPLETPLAVDRTLATQDYDLNALVWSAAGYAQLPNIAELVIEYGDQFHQSEMKS